MSGSEKTREALRAERIARERAGTGRRRRRRGLIGAASVLLGVVLAVILVVALDGGGHRGARRTGPSGSSPAAQTRSARAEHHVRALLTGIPESGDNVLGRAGAPITIIEYGDLECVVCDSFAVSADGRVSDGTRGTGIEDAIITRLVRSGRAKLAYDALDSATADGVTPGEFVPQQTAVLAAGRQHRAWYFIELFYNEQHPEGTRYVTPAYLESIARQVPGLNLERWRRDLHSPQLAAQVLKQETRGTLIGGGAALTPTVVVQSHSSGVLAAQGIPTLAQVEQAIHAVA